jgi:hypothetical protein
MSIDAVDIKMELLRLQIELDESNYKYAVELQKDYDTLWRVREEIKQLKEELREIERDERIRLYGGTETDEKPEYPDLP